MEAAFAPLKEICPDRATPALVEMTARLGSMMPYRQAAGILAEFLPIEPTETHATVRKRTIRICQRLDEQITKESWCARAQMDNRRQFEMQLPGDRRKEFVISIDTAHVRSADKHSARNFEIVVAPCGRGGREIQAASISPPATPANMQYGIVPFTRLGKRGIAALAM